MNANIVHTMGDAPRASIASILFCSSNVSVEHVSLKDKYVKTNCVGIRIIKIKHNCMFHYTLVNDNNIIQCQVQRTVNN